MAKRKNLFLPEPRWTMLRLFRLALLLVLLVVLGVAAWVAHFAFTPIDVPAKARIFNVDQGRSLRGVAEDFARAGLISDSLRFLLLARLLGSAGEVKAGSYSVDPTVTPYRLLEKIVRGEFTQAEIRFLEGWTFRQMRAALDQHPSIRHDTLGLADERILARLEITEKSAEGLFYPDTYWFAAGTSDLTILRQSYGRMQTKLQSLWEQRASGLPLSNAYQALILASIVEKETGREEERDTVAAVFVNRLKRGMRLQTDPTVIYGLGESFDGNLRRRDLQTDNSHNTYTRRGLPPTPIAMPREASIRAALNPAASSALYFVSRGDGSHQFSDSLVEHNRAVAKYQRAR
jgi:UPF0755 protein